MFSNLDNQIEHLTWLLKWRMDQTNEEDPRVALCRATEVLHVKSLENYRRWVKYVNLQQCSVKERVREDSGYFSGSFLSLSALSGSAWEFFGVWGFTSDMNEGNWVCNAQLHRLLLWYLIWGEASNLRFAPELLCFLFYCMSNALLLSTRSELEVRAWISLSTSPSSRTPSAPTPRPSSQPKSNNPFTRARWRYLRTRLLTLNRIGSTAS